MSRCAIDVEFCSKLIGLACIAQPWVQLFKTISLLVNVTLKFKTLLSEICQYFLLKKKNISFSLIFQQKRSVYLDVKVKHLMSGPHNKLIKLRML